MSLIKQSTDQAREAFTAMPMQSRVISIMLVAAIAIGLAFLIRGESSAGKDALFGGQSFGEQELAAIEMAFSRANLNDWEREGRRIKIPRETKAAYLAALEESSNLPLTLRSSVQEAINATTVFDSSDLRIAREMHAKEQDLGNKIAALHEVRWASVEYDRGERRGLSRSTPQSASVVVQPEGTAPLPRPRIMAIKELIRGSYAGMSIDDVVVIDTNSTSTSSLTDDQDPLLRKQQEAEAWVEQKVRRQLVGYPARIAVFAEIDPTMEVETTSLKYDAEPTNLSTKTRKVESSSNRPQHQGVPGRNQKRNHGSHSVAQAGGGARHRRAAVPCRRRGPTATPFAQTPAGQMAMKADERSQGHQQLFPAGHPNNRLHHHGVNREQGRGEDRHPGGPRS